MTHSRAHGGAGRARGARTRSACTCSAWATPSPTMCSTAGPTPARTSTARGSSTRRPPSLTLGQTLLSQLRLQPARLGTPTASMLRQTSQSATAAAAFRLRSGAAAGHRMERQGWDHQLARRAELPHRRQRRAAMARPRQPAAQTAQRGKALQSRRMWRRWPPCSPRRPGPAGRPARRRAVRNAIAPAASLLQSV